MRGQSGGKVKKISEKSENFKVVRGTYPSAFGSAGIGSTYSNAFKSARIGLFIPLWREAYPSAFMVCCSYRMWVL